MNKSVDILKTINTLSEKASLLTDLAEYVNILKSENDLGISLDYSSVNINFYKTSKKIFINLNEEEIKNFIFLLSNFIGTTNVPFRNAITHYLTMSKNNAEFAINSFLFFDKTIVDFYFNIEGVRND